LKSFFVQCHFEAESARNYRGLAISGLISGTLIQAIKILGCTFKDFNYGIEVNGYAVNVRIAHNIFDNCEKGVMILGNNANYIRIISNDFLSCGRGIEVSGSHTGIDIIDNFIFLSEDWGIVLLPGGSEEIGLVNIHENRIYYASQSENNAYSSLYLNACNDVSILNNKIYGVASGGGAKQPKYPIEAVTVNRVVEAGNRFANHATGNYAYHGTYTNVFSADNMEGTDNLTSRDATFINPILKPATASQKVRIITAADVGVYNDMVYFENNYVGGEKIGLLANKDIFMLYQNGVALAKMELDTVRFATGRLGNAAVPGNFAAAKILTVYDNAGTPYYIPVSASTW